MNEGYGELTKETWALEADLTDFTAKTGGSGLVPAGNFELRTVSVEPDGTNVKYVDVIVGPSHAGVQIVTINPAPIGEPDSKQVKNGLSFLGQRLTAYCWHKGSDPEAIKKKFKLTADKVIGKCSYATLRPGNKGTKDGREFDYSGRSEIQFFVQKTQFEASPGPFESGTAPRTSEKSKVLEATNGSQQAAAASAPAKKKAEPTSDVIDI